MNPPNKIVIDRDVLEKYYYVDKLTAQEIGKLLGCSKSTVLRNMRENGITREKQLLTYSASKEQHDLLVGSRLGDGSFCSDGGNYRVSFRHAENQRGYLEFKFNLIKEFCKKQSIGVSDGNKKSFDEAQLIYYFHTRALPLFNGYNNMSIIDALSQLNKNSLLIWLMDDGSLYSKNHPKGYSPYYTLSVNRFKENEISFLRDKIRQLFDIDFTITDYDDLLHEGKYKYGSIYFSVTATQKLNEIFKSSSFYDDIKQAIPYKIID